jgi:hypothetical protein
MPTVYFGTKDEPGFELEQSDDLIVVRRVAAGPLPRPLGPCPPRCPPNPRTVRGSHAYPEAGVEVYRVPVSRGGRSPRTKPHRPETLR